MEQNAMQPLDPRVFWMGIGIQALMKSHPNPAALRKAFDDISEEFLAHLLAGSQNEPWLAAFQALRGGYEAWLPAAPAADR